MSTLDAPDGDAVFRKGMKDASVSPLWDVMAALVTETPQPRAVPYVWPYADVQPQLIEAGHRITAAQAERRVLILENPGTDGDHTITDALYAGLQLVLPGETAPVHRHTQSALRFVLESDSAWTSVDGEPVKMQPFDLVLTPSWRWHEHGGATSPTIWLDGLDIPIVQRFSAGFAERDGNVPANDDAVSGRTRAAYGANLKPARTQDIDTETPLFHFPYAVWSKSLAEYAAKVPVDPHRGWTLEFTNPRNGGSVMRTISAFVTWVPPGMTTKPRRQSAGAVYAGVCGVGTLIVDDTPLTVGPRDVAAVPSWGALQIENSSDEPLVLFSYSDRACHEKLGFWKESLEQ
ncbi:cupin domain-containing protein [uncultured Tateyamaria sp.]|uniref:cupin domain-containing protein n=1 Tax=uncultured Tateyamaria sp. TaxID=455651 RepID=UPI002601D311|nr:cupin domain-containing protein [uncultured Tateyamaria sp.]